jgi:hypothetical protein
LTASTPLPTASPVASPAFSAVPFFFSSAMVIGIKRTQLPN